ncbi:hypothetical protein [Paenibacillus kandeliae]|uniref:hypothetical protein n=1 Tax=Paenibacillus kandeliae TaxID=3231269 RepID=UPI00345873E8
MPNQLSPTYLIIHFMRILVEAIAIYPILVLLDGYWLHTGQPWMWSLLLLSCAGIGSGWNGTGNENQQSRIGSVTIWFIYVLLAAGSLYMLLQYNGTTLHWIVSIILMVGGLLRGRMLMTGSWDMLFPIRIQLIALGLTWVVYIAAGRSEGLYDVRGTLYAAGACMLFSLLFRFGAQQIDYISLDEGFSLAALRAVISRSRRWIWLAVVIIALIGGSNQISAWLWSVWQSLLGMLTPASVPPPQTVQPNYTPPPQEPLFLPQSEDHSMNPFWIQKIAQIAMLLAGSAFVGWLGWLLFRLIRKYAPRLYRWLLALWEPMDHNHSAQSADAYIDELEAIQPTHNKQKRRLFANRRLPDDPAARIRYHYRELLRRAQRKGVQVAPSATPLEVGRQLEPTARTEQGTGIPDRIAKYEYDRSDQQQSISTPSNHTENKALSHGTSSASSSPSATSIRQLIALYNRARYDEKPVAMQEVEEWEQQNKQLPK